MIKKSSPKKYRTVFGEKVKDSFRNNEPKRFPDKGSYLFGVIMGLIVGFQICLNLFKH